MPQNGMLAASALWWVFVLATWILVPVVIVVLIRIGMRPTNERLDRLARLLEQRRDAGA